MGKEGERKERKGKGTHRVFPSSERSDHPALKALPLAKGELVGVVSRKGEPTPLQSPLGKGGNQRGRS
jgi:hypothetical protein